MNAPAPNDFRIPSAERNAHDEKMQQIRELLFGDVLRHSDARSALLEARIRELELTVHRRLDAIQARLEALAGDAVSDRRSAFEELARGVQDLSDRIRRIPRE